MHQEIINGFVLRKTPYSETSLITSLFTLERGRIDFIMRGERKISKSHLPKVDLLRFISVSYSYKEKNELQSAGTIEVLKDYSHIATKYRLYERVQWVCHLLNNNLMTNDCLPLTFESFKALLDAYCDHQIGPSQSNSLLCGFLLNYLLEQGQIDPDILNQGTPSLSLFIESLQSPKKSPNLDQDNWETVLLWLERCLQNSRHKLPNIHLTNFSKK